MLQEFLEGALDGELEAHIEDEGANNRKNGWGGKRVKTAIGSVDINPSPDRNSTFDPEIIPKRHKTLGENLDRQIISSLYACGISYSDMYGLEASTATIGRVKEKFGY